jgi:hypothetical protein
MLAGGLRLGISRLQKFMTTAQNSMVEDRCLVVSRAVIMFRMYSIHQEMGRKYAKIKPHGNISVLHSWPIILLTDSKPHKTKLVF